MKFTHTKHPALPQDESGWFLYRASATTNNRKPKWKAGYHGKVHPHCWRNFNTEKEAIAWVNEKHAEFTSNAQGNDVVMNALCRAWRVA